MLKYIKLFYVALFATLTLGLTACGDDDDDDEPGTGKSAIVGTWQGSYDPDEGYDDEDDDIITMTFTKDGKMTANGISLSDPDYGWGFSGNYKVDDRGMGQRMFISITGYFDGDDEFYDDDEEYRGFTIKGDELRIFFDGSDYLLYRQ